jgi:hypothetical protein
VKCSSVSNTKRACFFVLCTYVFVPNSYKTLKKIAITKQYSVISNPFVGSENKKNIKKRAAHHLLHTLFGVEALIFVASLKERAL